MCVCNQMIDIITADTSPRPDGAPPTYDDAMKFVNDAFEHTEDTDVCVCGEVEKQIFSNYSLQTEEEPPPSYSPTLKEGEEACTSSSTSSYPPRDRSSAGGRGAALQPAAYSSPTSHSNLPSSPPPYS